MRAFFLAKEKMYTLEIKKEYPDELFPHVKIEDLLVALADYSNFLKHKTKYGGLSEMEQKAFEECQEMFFKTLKEYGCLDLLS